DALSQSRLELSDRWPSGQPVAPEHGSNSRNVFLVDIMPTVRKKGIGHAAMIFHPYRAPLGRNLLDETAKRLDVQPPGIVVAGVAEIFRNRLGVARRFQFSPVTETRLN